MTKQTRIENIGDRWPFPQRGNYNPHEWRETTGTYYFYFLDFPSHGYFTGGYMMGEPTSHDANGHARYSAFVMMRRRFFVRDVSVDELNGALLELAELLDTRPYTAPARENADRVGVVAFVGKRTLKVNTDVLRQWIKQVVGNRPINPEPQTDEARQQLESLKRDIARIHADGGIVEIPFD